MGTAPQAVDSKTRQRLAMRRLIVIDADAARAEAFADALRAGGATAVAVGGAHTQLEAVHKLDAEVALVNADAPQACRQAVAELQCHPRTRWATVLWISFSELWPAGALAPDLSHVADQVSAAVAPVVEFAVRAKGKLPYTTALEPLGPNRLLRALANTGRKLRVTISDDRLHAEVELGDRRISSACARVAGDACELTNAEALAAVLATTSARVLVEERATDLRRKWNVSLDGALSAAAALDHPVPEGLEAFACGVAIDPPSGVQPTSARRAQSADESGLPGDEAQVTVPRISLAELYAEHAASVPEAPDGDANEPLVVVESLEPAVRVEIANEAALAAESHEPSVVVVIETTKEAAIAVAEALATPHAETRDPAVTVAAEPERTRRKRARAPAIIAATVALAGALALLAYLQPVETGELARRLGLAVTPHPEAPPALAGTATLAVAALSPRAQPVLAAAAPAELPATEPAEAAGAEPPPAIDTRASETPRKPPTRDELRRAERLTDRAKRHRRAHRYAAAAAAYQKALELVPRHPAATLGMVRLYLSSENGAEAVRWAEQLVALQPDGQSGQLLLGDAHKLNGDRALAEQAWRRARELGSDTARKRLRSRAQR